MLWKKKLDDWTSGLPLTYPKHIHHRFFYETSVCTNTGLTSYKEEFITDPNELEQLVQDFSAYKSYIQKSKNRMATSFMNLDGTVRLVIPIPRKGKNFTTVKDFIDNAVEVQQKAFWKLAAKMIRKELKKYPCLYISVHGLGVPYFHLRIERVPKYYRSIKFVHTLPLHD